MVDLTNDEIQWIKNKKAIEDLQKQIEVITTDKESQIAIKEEEIKTLKAEMETDITALQNQIDSLKV